VQKTHLALEEIPMPLETDRSTWPVVSYTTKEETTKEDVAKWAQECAKHIDFCRERGFRIAFLHDIEGMASVSPAARKIGADYIEQNRADLAKYVACFVWIVQSQMAKGAITALLWLVDKMPVPYKIFTVKQRPEAMAWCKEQIRLKVAAKTTSAK
jgi:hypothetical protein